MIKDKVTKAYDKEIDDIYGEIAQHDHKGSQCTCNVWYDELEATIKSRDEYREENDFSNEVRDEHILSAKDVL